MIKISTFVVGAALGLAAIAQAHAPALQVVAAADQVSVNPAAADGTRLLGHSSRTFWFDHAIDDITTGHSVPSGAEGRGASTRNSV